MQDDKVYTINQAIELIRSDEDLIFEIRDFEERCKGWYEHMLLICNISIYGCPMLQFWTKPREGITPYKWILQDYIPFSENVKWYISPLIKTDVHNSIKEIGVR